MGKIVKQIYLKMLIQPSRLGLCFPDKNDAELLLKCLVSNSNDGIAGMIFIDPRRR